LTERRVVWVLAAVLVGMLLLLATQAAAGGNAAEGNALQRGLLRLVGPVARTAASTREWVGGLGGGFESRETLRRENRDLSREVEELQLELFQLRNLERQVDRLAEAVRYDVPEEGPMQAADVVYADATSVMGSLILYVGDAEVTVNQPVVSGQGLVGRVAFVSGPFAKVQLVTDRSATVGARIERTRRQGLLRGEPDGGLSLDYVPLQNDVRVGDRVRTSGIDGVYPPGIRLGTVISVEPGRQLFHVIRVQPEVDLGSLDQVYLLEPQEIPGELEEEPS
jgi:rod shape-determining protein MreC